MLDNIKSSFFIKDCLSKIAEKRKLELIKYNKNFQTILNINIINYKILYEKYIIYESNTFAKEFSFYDKLLFEGEYLNGKRNGKGKEYDYGGILIFEGEFFNDKRWNGKGYNKNNIIYELKDGKGYLKEYKNNKIIFEGEYINGLKNGYGKAKEYYYNGKLEFVGEYLNGKRHGKGKEYYRNDGIFII